MTLRSTITVVAALTAFAPLCMPRGTAAAQSEAPAAHQYVVSVSGMH
jgi:hypothetical protein